MSQSITLKENEFKKFSKQFRMMASRFLYTSYDDANDNLDRFLQFINSSPIISSFIEEHNKTEYDMHSLIEGSQFNTRYKLPLDPSEEIAYVYQMLSYVSTNNIDFFRVIMGYSGRRFQEMTDSFNNQVVKVLIDHILTYLGELAVDMGYDKKSGGTHFNFGGDFRGQLNHAEGQSTISANQTYIETQIAELKGVSHKYIKALADDQSIPSEQKEEVAEFLEAAVVEAESDKPKKAIVKTATEKLQDVQTVATTGSAVYTLGEQLLTLVQGIIS
ncbi:hypothetical protein [Metabacillus hrfriensis]|uniref:Uncharacterized protein n=1 Tax=Metabacillus hrfriensis TaxID=3048891 RepID=A0ACD4RE42_9BACI|nr:hypothetical protein [Metabacillus sp. CT-WN-B3]WHZ58776.1 hypothetical protein QLQ22_05400 [Metabacillus sp. CT-WN-B3]